MSILAVDGLAKAYGGVQAVAGVSFALGRGEFLALIGPNGAGKTTFFNVVTGLYAPDAGRFEFDGRPYRPHAIHEVVRIGIARTFQNIRLFGGMSVIENVAVARNAHTHSGLLGPILRTPAFLREERAVREHALELLDVVNLRAQAARAASTLSYGEQRRLEIARALATEPKLLALDEPAAGMNATEKLQLRELIESIRARGLTILLIEHDVKLVMGLCDQVTVLDQGRRIARGTPAEVSRDEAVIEAYLGTSAAHARTAANAS